MLPKLYDRFVTFCRSDPGAEEIDAIPLTPEQKASKRREFVYKLMATLKLFVNVGEGTSGHKTPQFEGS